MKKRRSIIFRHMTAAALTAAIFAGCDSKKNEPAPPPGPAAEADVVAKLAKADALDGKTDKVVTKCGNCALGMDGKAEFTLKTHGYDMYFCSAGCKEAFEKETDKKIMAMTIPG